MPEETTHGEQKHPLAQMLIIGAVASVAGVALALAIDWFPAQASSQADDIDTLWDVLLIVSVPIFVLVEVVVLYSVWKFRMRPGEELKDGPPIHGNTTLEVIWTAIPAILLVALCSYAYVVLNDIEEAQANEMRVNVIGEQFTWTFQYPQPGGGKPITSNQLYLPKDRPIRFHVRSKDVIHDFWVPSFRMKIDAVPGITTRYRVTPTRLGTYPVVCAELCGLGHAVMRQRARVVTTAEFTEWLNERKQAAAGGGAAGGEAGGAGADTAAAGKAVFTGEASCGACHRLADAGGTGTVGPDLDETLSGQSKDQIRESIVNPEAEIAEGFPGGVMPTNFGETLSDAELNSLVDYLAEVAGK